MPLGNSLVALLSASGFCKSESVQTWVGYDTFSREVSSEGLSDNASPSSHPGEATNEKPKKERCRDRWARTQTSRRAVVVASELTVSSVRNLW